MWSGIGMSILIVLFSRTFNIFPLSALVNLGRGPVLAAAANTTYDQHYSGTNTT